MTSPDDLGDNLSRDISEPIAPSRVAVGQSLAIHAHQVQNRRVQVMHMHASVEDAGAEVVGPAVLLGVGADARSTSVRSTRPIALRSAAGRLDASVMTIGQAQ